MKLLRCVHQRRNESNLVHAISLLLRHKKKFSNNNSFSELHVTLRNLNSSSTVLQEVLHNLNRAGTEIKMPLWINVDILIKTSKCHSFIEYFKIKLITSAAGLFRMRITTSVEVSEQFTMLLKYLFFRFFSSAVDVLRVHCHTLRHNIICFNRNVKAM